MLALAKAALHGTNPDEDLFANAAETDWNELLEQSTAQGVMVLSLNGAMRLPKQLQPPLQVKMRWIVRADAAEKWYRHCLETAKDLAARFRESNIRMLLFKGIALSRLYPVPASREFGDIDIFLFGKSEEGNVVLERLAGKKIIASKKHSNFFYKGILIENHHTFLNQSRYKSFQHSEYLEKQLMSLLAEIDIPDETNDSLLFPPPCFDALYIALHTLSHLSGKIVLRQLCDLTVLFTAYKGKIDFSIYRNALSKAGLLKSADALISLSVSQLGLNPEYAPPYESDPALENRIWNDLLNPEIPAPPKEKRTLLNVVIYKMKLLRSRYWKNELVFPGQYGKRILYSTVNYLRHPDIIKKVF